ncbi:DUF1566 domain-containing protein [Halochromatium salexigens]|nr:DUF1566 domain-containing protein [Halochromatium salexigens]
MMRTLTALGMSLCMIAAQAEQTCNDAVVATAPDSRFQDNGNGTVTDLATGLIWKQCAEGLSGAGCATGSAQTFSWQVALQHAEAAVFAGSDLWRLPNKNELASLVELRCYNPAINERYFPNTPSNWFWSSSPYASYSGFAWSVQISIGNVSSHGKSIALYVHLVRAAQSLQLVPALFRGEWNADIAECGTGLGDSSLRISADSIQFHESDGPLTNIERLGDSEFKATALLSGEGEVWSEPIHFALSSDSNTLTDLRSEVGGFSRRRCP